MAPIHHHEVDVPFVEADGGARLTGGGAQVFEVLDLALLEEVEAASQAGIGSAPVVGGRRATVGLEVGNLGGQADPAAQLGPLEQQFSVGPAGGEHDVVVGDQGAAALGADLPDVTQDGPGWRHDPGRLGELDLQLDALISLWGLRAALRGIQGQLGIAFPEIQCIDVQGGP